MIQIWLKGSHEEPEVLHLPAFVAVTGIMWKAFGCTDADISDANN
jgi:hypothetical protein